jgi:hypothetical protein
MSAVAKQEIQTIEPQSLAITPMDMLNQAVERGATIETLDRLMSLQERWEKNQARKEFDAAIAEAKKKIKPVLKNRAGHNTRYADFAAVAAAVDPALSEVGLSYRFRTSQDERIHVTCILSHRAGHSEENTIAGPADTSGSKNAIQAIGSTLTYLQRYSLMQAVGLAATIDDDARTADTGELLAAEQVEEMRSEIIERGVDLAKFLRWVKVEKIEDIAAVYFDSCMAEIKRFRK